MSRSITSQSPTGVATVYSTCLPRYDALAMRASSAAAPAGAERCRITASGRIASVTGPGRAPRRGRSSSSRAEPHQRPLAPLLDELGLDQVRVADEVGDEEVRRLLVELARRAGLRDAGVRHHDDAVGDGERLLLVVGHVGDGEVEVAAAARGCRRARGGGAWRRGWRAARRRAAPAARARGRGRPRRAAAGRRTARRASASRGRRGRRARASRRRAPARWPCRGPARSARRRRSPATLMCGNRA